MHFKQQYNKINLSNDLQQVKLIYRLYGNNNIW